MQIYWSYGTQSNAMHCSNGPWYPTDRKGRQNTGSNYPSWLRWSAKGGHVTQRESLHLPSTATRNILKISTVYSVLTNRSLYKCDVLCFLWGKDLLPVAMTTSHKLQFRCGDNGEKAIEFSHFTYTLRLAIFSVSVPLLLTFFPFPLGFFGLVYSLFMAYNWSFFTVKTVSSNLQNHQAGLEIWI